MEKKVIDLGGSTMKTSELIEQLTWAIVELQGHNPDKTKVIEAMEKSLGKLMLIDFNEQQGAK